MFDNWSVGTRITTPLGGSAPETRWPRDGTEPDGVFDFPPAAWPWDVRRGTRFRRTQSHPYSPSTPREPIHQIPSRPPTRRPCFSRAVGSAAKTFRRKSDATYNGRDTRLTAPNPISAYSAPRLEARRRIQGGVFKRRPFIIDGDGKIYLRRSLGSTSRGRCRFVRKRNIYRTPPLFRPDFRVGVQFFSREVAGRRERSTKMLNVNDTTHLLTSKTIGKH